MNTGTISITWPYRLALWRVALGLVAGALTVMLLMSFLTYGAVLDSVMTLGTIFALPALVLVVVPFLWMSARSGRLTLKRSLVLGGVLTGLPVLLFNVFLQTPIGDDRSFIWSRTLLAVLCGLIGTAAAWLIAIGPLAEPPRKAQIDGH
jgi:hypothetical protein